jgi:hypothetical protein
VQNQSEWWIFWGRAAGGLNRNQQVDIYQRLSATLLPKKGERVRVNSSLLREMWRCAASLELLPVQTRTEIGEALLKQIRSGDFKDSELWCMARLGARDLFHGPANLVLPPATVSRWVESLAKVEGAADALASMARRTGDVTRDLPAPTIEIARRAIEKDKDAAKHMAVFEGRARDDASLSRIFGEDLPSGLVIRSAAPAGGEAPAHPC